MSVKDVVVNRVVTPAALRVMQWQVGGEPWDVPDRHRTQLPRRSRGRRLHSGGRMGPLLLVDPASNAPVPAGIASYLASLSPGHLAGSSAAR